MPTLFPGAPNSLGGSFHRFFCESVCEWNGNRVEEFACCHLCARLPTEHQRHGGAEQRIAGGGDKQCELRQRFRLERGQLPEDTKDRRLQIERVPILETGK